MKGKIVVQQNRYAAIIVEIFFSKYKPGMKEVDFKRTDMVKFAQKLQIDYPKNLGDLVYSFRYRALLPQRIRETAPKGQSWIIRPAGKARYRFALVSDVSLEPNPNMAETKVPNATPGIVAKYAFNDEQALLAKLRYNRLIDIFTGVTCYSLQSHLRTTVPNMGQVETDEIYVGVDKKGVQYVFPVQAKGGTDKLSIVQIEQDFGVCEHKFPELICRPIGAQFAKDGVIVLFEFEQGTQGVHIVGEKHYRLVAPEDVTEEDLKSYRSRLSE
jgi:hypothetical protein